VLGEWLRYMPAVQQTLFDRVRFERLDQLARERYGSLSDAEMKVLLDSTSSSSSSVEDSMAHPPIEPDFLRWLVVDSSAAPLIDPKGLRVHHANIRGSVDLDGCKVSFPMEFNDCSFDREFSIKSAQIESLSISDSTLTAGINGELSIFHGSLFLERSRSSGPLLFEATQITGDLNCYQTSVHFIKSALVLDRTTVQGGVFLTHFRCQSAIRIRSAQIGGSLAFFGARIDASGQAISLDRSTIKGSVFLKEEFSTSGSIGMFGVNIDGDLDLSEAKLEDRGVTLNLDRATVHGSVFMNDGFQTPGTVSMFATHIGGDLDCAGANFESAGPTLHLDQAAIQGQVMFTPSFRSSGEIQMFSTQIGGNLNCSGASLAGAEECIVLFGASIKGNVLMTNGTKCEGRVQMYGAQISGDVDCTSAEFRLPAVKGAKMADHQVFSLLALENAHIRGNVILSRATCAGRITLAGAVISGGMNCQGTIINGSELDQSLSLDDSIISGDVFLSKGFRASAAVGASNAQISGDFDCYGASFKSYLCPKMKLTGDLTLVGIRQPHFYLDLRNASVRLLHDEVASWPQKGLLRLDGFAYQDLYLHSPATPTAIKSDKLPDSVSLDTKTRISWLQLQPASDQTSPQPWMQLASLLESKGNLAGAKQVRFQFSRIQALSAYPLMSGLSLVYNWIEEDPRNVFWPILLLWLFGALVFWRARRMNAMAPTDKDAFDKFNQFQPLPEQITPFNPAIYTLENVLPVVKLGQDAAWAPNPLAKPTSWLPTHQHMGWTRWLPGFNYHWLALLRWTLILLGWALALILGAAIGSRFKS
jgi:hypothetical protein